MQLKSTVVLIHKRLQSLSFWLNRFRYIRKCTNATRRMYLGLFTIKMFSLFLIYFLYFCQSNSTIAHLSKKHNFFTILPYAVYKKKFFFRNICTSKRKSVILPSILMRRLQFYPPPEKGARGVLVSNCAHAEICAHTRQNKPWAAFYTPQRK